MQADILKLNGADLEYDHINCFGVLMLLEDTEKGLLILRDRLVNGGTMLVALYSTLGRLAVAWARDLLREQGYHACEADMRQCRQDLVNMQDHEHAAAIVNSLAFYNMNNLRDLLFHSMEKTFILPQIQEMLQKLELEFLGFEIGIPAIVSQYRHQFPGDHEMRSLANWHQFEQANPDTFANCHALWLRK